MPRLLKLKRTPRAEQVDVYAGIMHCYVLRPFRRSKVYAIQTYDHSGGRALLWC